MTDKDNGGYINPPGFHGGSKGTTRRDRLADKAMVSMLNALIIAADKFAEGKLDEKLSTIHKWAYTYADRQIAEGKK